MDAEDIYALPILTAGELNGGLAAAFSAYCKTSI